LEVATVNGQCRHGRQYNHTFLSFAAEPIQRLYRRNECVCVRTGRYECGNRRT
jgi:hypothetical protein